MTVRELIDLLSARDPDAVVVGADYEFDWQFVTGVEPIVLTRVTKGAWEHQSAGSFVIEGGTDEATKRYGEYKGGVTFADVPAVILTTVPKE